MAARVTGSFEGTVALTYLVQCHRGLVGDGVQPAVGEASSRMLSPWHPATPHHPPRVGPQTHRVGRDDPTLPVRPAQPRREEGELLAAGAGGPDAGVLVEVDVDPGALRAVRG